MGEERKWEDLGVDCLAIIFSKLDLEDLTLSVPLVCRPWLEASMDSQCWNVLNFRDVDFMPWSSYIDRMKRTYDIKRFSFSRFSRALLDRGNGSTVEIAFPADHSASFDDLAYASVRCPRLKVLSLPNLFHPADKRLPGLIEKWKDLEFLTMGRKPSSFVAIIEQISVHCKNFVGLGLSGCIGNKDALAIVKHLPTIKYLALSRSSLSKSDLLAILDGCKQLEVVDVSCCTGFDVDDDILKAGSRVKAFECEGAKMEEDYLEYYCDHVYWGMVF